MSTDRIFKYPLEITDMQRIQMPLDAHLLTVQVQGIVPTIWARVNTELPLRHRRIAMYGTGHPLPENPGAYLGTVQMPTGAMLVWHVYDLGER